MARSTNVLREVSNRGGRNVKLQGQRVFYSSGNWALMLFTVVLTFLISTLVAQTTPVTDVPQIGSSKDDQLQQRRYLADDPADPATEEPTGIPSSSPITSQPSGIPSASPSSTAPSYSPSESPSITIPSAVPSDSPSTSQPSLMPTTFSPTSSPSAVPTTSLPTLTPSRSPSTSLPTADPSRSPSSSAPSMSPSARPTTSLPTSEPSHSPTVSSPSQSPSHPPTTAKPSSSPSASPTVSHPTLSPSRNPTSSSPSFSPSKQPTSSQPTGSPSQNPTSSSPSASPSNQPTTSHPSSTPSSSPTSSSPSVSPSNQPTVTPSAHPITSLPTSHPTSSPTKSPSSSSPTFSPSKSPSKTPTSSAPTNSPSTSVPSAVPTRSPTTSSPSRSPTTSMPSKSPTTSKPSRSPTNSPTITTSSPTFKNKPNVLLIISDDLKPLLSPYNLPFTDNLPNINYISENGVTFMNANTQMSICGPSRASFLTSLRPDKVQVFNLVANRLGTRIQESIKGSGRKIETMPEWFKRNGYATYGSGKVFHENEYNLYTAQNTWTEPIYTWMDKFPRAPSFKKPYQGSWIDFPEVDDSFFTDAQVANLSASIITDKLANLDGPWFFAVGFYKPHLPFQCPRKYFEMSAGEPVPPMGNPAVAGFNSFWLGVAKGGVCSEVKDYSGVPNKQLSNRSPLWVKNNAVRGYRATVAFLDVQIGKLIDALRTSNQLEHTHIIFLGDHGFHLGDKGLYCKHTNFEQAVRSPLIIMPALREVKWEASRGKRSYAPVELLDVLPTMAEMTSVPLKNGPNDGLYKWQGRSLVPILEDPDNGYVKPFAMAQFPRGTGSSKKMGYTLRTTRYRVTVWCAAPFKITSKCYYEMYDFLADPSESKNLANVAAMRPIRNRIMGAWTAVQTFNKAKIAASKPKQVKKKKKVVKKKSRGLSESELEGESYFEEEDDDVEDDETVLEINRISRELIESDTDPSNNRPFDFDDRFALSESSRQPFP